MKKKEAHNSTDESEINELLGRLERGELRAADAQLLGRLLQEGQRWPLTSVGG